MGIMHAFPASPIPIPTVFPGYVSRLLAAFPGFWRRFPASGCDSQLPMVLSSFRRRFPAVFPGFWWHFPASGISDTCIWDVQIPSNKTNKTKPCVLALNYLTDWS